MLTSSANQYLRPEYLTPLPTTLDAKKSPLALLAQTCSQIGVDPPSSKSILALDKSSKSSKSSSDSSSRDKSSPSSQATSASSVSSSYSSVSDCSKSSSGSNSSSFKPYESCVSRDKASSPEQPRVPSAHSNSGSSSSSSSSAGNSRSRTPGSGSRRCPSNQSASSSGAGGRAITPQGRKSTTPGSEGHRDSPSARAPSGGEPRSASVHSPGNLQIAKSTYSPLGLIASSGGSAQEQYSAAVAAGFRPSGLGLSTAAAAGATTTTTPSAAYGLPFPGQLPPMDPMTASSLMSQHHAALKNGLAGNPYLGYARMKTPSGADTLVPVCRDPFCTGCPLSSHLLAAAAASSSPGAASPASGPGGPKLPGSPAPGAACPAGCAQCDHSKQQQQQAQPAVSAAAAAAAASSPYAAYAAHAQLVALAAASQLPYACSWIGSDASYCGKRFASTDELVQHYRSHSGAEPGSATAAAQAAATTAAALSLLTPAGLGPGHPLLSRSYPTPPLSPLASARYHPYGKPYPGPPLSSLGLALPPPHPHPAAAGLPPYFSPYSLYAAGSRLGATTGMHP